ncbi:MAG: UDP-N-acetylglucosamine 1-carboxyvinyltransferase [Candidatus Yanofskybacteria bacterium RIFCSPHIGHO2_01_FULL_43_32]|nr:MAG: UDP-N-acetylglucosamine 1-carboxyvinyltransferase [Candidatus Yanofskybacteria bacterium RIFCSPHIGHO2_01_FULL_43_32]OGN11954.1 MAG: UDP-N-acetylglucosamine 1-carboxyvinyltransferase [Candidatus Yanofskybacteria bacterium RIFCSPHIGHO2_02_FULL_43_12]OGN24366.1 MAG: UDP-N-acetylglucosamine 1-carboxyvinyltransferase [Candidatus Yanofskybacteria bacterium RIFCSPLOWO2_01_FULL_43_46]
MDKFVINGGNKLKGKIEVRGAKNAALKIFAASVLTSGTVRIKNVPEVEDIVRISELLKNLGVEVLHPKHGEYRITAAKIKTSAINPKIAKKLRASIVLTASLLARAGNVKFPHPGGCVIGERPIDIFLDGYKTLGAKINYRNGLYEIKGKLIGAKFTFNNVSVTGTEAMIMAASLAKGKTILKNCACEPEIESLANFLNSCGAKIQGAGTPFIAIEGVKSLIGGEYQTIPDRIEAGTFAILAAATKSNILIKNCEPEHLDSLWNVLRKAGVRLNIGKNQVEVIPSGLKTVNVKTHEYPGFPTDLQSPVCVLLTQAEGQGLVHETIYEGRLLWTEELKRMGANVLMHDPHRISIQGPTKLRSRNIESPDLRAGMAYLIAVLCAKGKSVINNVYQIDRGYEKIEERLRKIGADIKRI